MLFRKKKIVKTPADIFRLLGKHQNKAEEYKNIQKHTIDEGEILEVQFHDGDYNQTTITQYLVRKAFNYYKEAKESIDEHFSYGNELNSFIGRQLKMIPNKDLSPTKTIFVHQHSYGRFKVD